MILLAMEELHMLGQHWQMAQAAEPKQLKREILSERILSQVEDFWPTSCNIYVVDQTIITIYG